MNETLKQWFRYTFPTIVIIVVVLFVLKVFQNFMGISTIGSSGVNLPKSFGGLTESYDMGRSSVGIAMPYPPVQNIAPSDSQVRIVIQDTNLSLVVTNVAKAITAVEDAARGLGGFLVDSNLSVPEGPASGYISVRVPSSKRQEALTTFKALGLKTVSESVHGTDVTDQYVDLDARLKALNATKTKFEKIQETAVEISDLLEVQRELGNIQQQIDSFVGQQKYLAESANLTKITINLSTDEYALPFTPDQPWRPEVIFKQAVRSLVGTFRSVATLLIWLVVYAPLWGGFLLLVWWLSRRNRKK